MSMDTRAKALLAKDARPAVNTLYAEPQVKREFRAPAGLELSAAATHDSEAEAGSESNASSSDVVEVNNQAEVNRKTVGTAEGTAEGTSKSKGKDKDKDKARAQGKARANDSDSDSDSDKGKDTDEHPTPLPSGPASSDPTDRAIAATVQAAETPGSEARQKAAPPRRRRASTLSFRDGTLAWFNAGAEVGSGTGEYEALPAAPERVRSYARSHPRIVLGVTAGLALVIVLLLAL